MPYTKNWTYYGDHRPAGNSTDRAVVMLRTYEDDPKIAALLAQVLAGTLSPHAAMVQAGFRKQSFTVSSNPWSDLRRSHGS